MSNSLQTHGLQHAMLPCPSLSLGVCSNSCSLSQWCHPNVSSCIVHFSSGLQSFPASGSLPMSQIFRSGGQSTGDSALASVLPMNILDWFPLGWTGWISLLSKGLASLLQHHNPKASILWRPAFFIVGEFLSCLGFRRILKIKLSLGKTMKNSLDLFRKQVLLR